MAQQSQEQRRGLGGGDPGAAHGAWRDKATPNPGIDPTERASMRCLLPAGPTSECFWSAVGPRARPGPTRSRKAFAPIEVVAEAALIPRVQPAIPVR
jgi:hypothetical protein